MSSSSTPKLKVTDIVGDRIYCTLEELKHFQGALKTLSKENYEKAKKQMLRNGFAAPFFVFKDANGLNILDGHQRHFTLLEMAGEGVELPTKFPCDLIKAKDVQHAKSLILAYNSQFGEMNDEGLYEFMFANQIDWSDVSTETRLPDIDNKKFEAKFWDTEDTSEKDDEVPEVKEPFVKPGELWILGNHRLLCGDATKKENVERLMNGEKADMVYTDPPYGMNLNTDYARSNRVVGKTYKPVEGDDKDYDPRELFKLFKDVEEQFWWGADYYCAHIPKGGAWVVWDKKKEDLDESIGTGFELCWSKQPHKRMIARFLWSGFTAKERHETRVHPTQKPVKLAEWFFERWGKDKTSIVDLYGGSGSTLIACEKTGKRCFMSEIDPHYCSVIIERWQKLTGKTAVKE